MWWRPLAWIAAFCRLLALVPVAEQAFGALAGCAVLLLAVALGFWRVERWRARALLVGSPHDDALAGRRALFPAGRVVAEVLQV